MDSMVFYSRPEGAPALCDDPSELGQPPGIHLEPLQRVISPSAPGPIIEVVFIKATLQARHKFSCQISMWRHEGTIHINLCFGWFRPYLSVDRRITRTLLTLTNWNMVFKWKRSFWVHNGSLLSLQFSGHFEVHKNIFWKGQLTWGIYDFKNEHFTLCSTPRIITVMTKHRCKCSSQWRSTSTQPNQVSSSSGAREVSGGRERHDGLVWSGS